MRAMFIGMRIPDAHGAKSYSGDLEALAAKGERAGSHLCQPQEDETLRHPREGVFQCFGLTADVGYALDQLSSLLCLPTACALVFAQVYRSRNAILALPSPRRTVYDSTLTADRASNYTLGLYLCNSPFKTVISYSTWLTRMYVTALTTRH